MRLAEKLDPRPRQFTIELVANSLLGRTLSPIVEGYMDPLNFGYYWVRYDLGNGQTGTSPGHWDGSSRWIVYVDGEMLNGLTNAQVTAISDELSPGASVTTPPPCVFNWVLPKAMNKDGNKFWLIAYNVYSPYGTWDCIQFDDSGPKQLSKDDIEYFGTGSATPPGW